MTCLTKCTLQYINQSLVQKTVFKNHKPTQKHEPRKKLFQQRNFTFHHVTEANVA